MLEIVMIGDDIKKLLIILFGICFVSAGNRLSVDTIVFSGNNLIKLTSQNNQLELKRKSDISSLKKKDDTSEKPSWLPEKFQSAEELAKAYTFE